MVWPLIQTSRYVVTSVDEKSVLQLKRDNTTWSRKDLQKECFWLYPQIPRGLRKQDYAKSLVVLRGVRKLQLLVQRRMYGIQSKMCCICKDPLHLPIFKHEAIGYHIRCILDWINISHKFTDPLTNKSYTDKELARIDRISAQYGIESDVLDLKHDVNRIAEDQDQREHEERLDILLDFLDSDIEAYLTYPSFSYGMGRNILCSHIKQTFRELTHLDLDSAQAKINALIDEHVNENENLNRLLFEIFELINEWATEDVEMESTSSFGTHVIPVLNMIFSRIPPIDAQTITINLPNSDASVFFPIAQGSRSILLP